MIFTRLISTTSGIPPCQPYWDQRVAARGVLNLVCSSPLPGLGTHHVPCNLYRILPLCQGSNPSPLSRNFFFFFLVFLKTKISESKLGSTTGLYSTRSPPANKKKKVFQYVRTNKKNKRENKTERVFFFFVFFVSTLVVVLICCSLKSSQD